MANETNKFSIAEACSNDNGKTSGSKVYGLFLGFISGLCILAGLIAFFMVKDSDRMSLLNWSMMLVTACTTLLLGTKYISQKFNKPDEKNDGPENS